MPDLSQVLAVAAEVVYQLSSLAGYQPSFRGHVLL